MLSHSKPADLAVTALLQNLNDELDRKKGKKMEDLMLAKMQSSVRDRLGPRLIKQDAHISHWRGGGELCGAIFMCNRRTWKECLGQCLFGLPIGKKNLVEQVIPEMKLFLFEYERRQLWGVFEAASYGAMDIIPNAYTGGSFPCQVRVRVPEECVALYEEEFCEAIKDNYYSLDKFHFNLSEKQVCHLTSLFERKYLSANMMHSKLLKYEDKRYITEGCKPNGGLPLLLTNDVTCSYPEDLLQHSWYSSFQVTNGPPLFNSKEGRDHAYKNGESRIGRKSSETGSLVPLPNGALDIVQSNVTSLTGELDFVTGDTILFPDNVSRLHSDRPTAKSVWARISGRSKSLVAVEPTQAKKTLNPVLISPPKVCTILEMDVADDSLVQDSADVREDGGEEFSVGFKRRRASNNNTSAKLDETPSKRRRKLTRPSFEVVADERLVEQGNFLAENPPLPSANGALDFSKSSSTAGIVEDFAGDVSMLAELPMRVKDKICLSCDVSKFTALDTGEGTCRPSTLDLNLPVEGSIQNDQKVAIVFNNSPVLKYEKQYNTDVAASQVSGNIEVKSRTKVEQNFESSNETRSSSLVCDMHQGPCSLALSLATQETVILQSREGIDDSNPADLTGHLQKQPRALALVEDVELDKPLLVDVPEIVTSQSKQGGRADGEGVENGTGSLDKEEQGSDLQQPHIFSESASSDLVAADSTRASTLSLAPCTPAKDFLDSVNEQCDDGKRISHDLVQDIPLTLKLGNGAQIPDVKLHLHDVVQPEDASDNSFKRELSSTAVVHDEPSDGNQSRESKTISLNCTSGSDLLNQVDLKSFLSSLQVSGIKLQLGASPCLILQLGDLAGSSSNVDSQDQGGATPDQPESG